MKYFRVEVRVDASVHPYTITLEGKGFPDSFFTKANSSMGVRQLRFGGITCPIQHVLSQRVMRSSGSVSKLTMSPEMANTLGIPNGHTIHLALQADTLILGPVVGLYVDIQENSVRRFGEQTQLFRELATLGEKMGVCVTIIGPPFHSTNVGWRLFPKKDRASDGSRTEWKRITIKKPDLVLRRSGGFINHKESIAIEDLRRFAKENKLHTLPRICSNKWNLYGFLKKIPEVLPHLPFTTVANEAKHVYEAVRTRKNVYIKPLSGSQGISIYNLRWNDGAILASWEERIVPRQTERLSTVFHPDTRIRELKLSSIEAFSQFWKETGLRRCLVQDKVSLCRIDEKPVDFRWLIQSSDHPVVVARVARVGKRGAITTNIHTGGQAVAFEDLIDQLPHTAMIKQDKDIGKKLDQLATVVMHRLASKYGPFVELGIDFAIDNHGKIFLFEVNPTPGRRMLKSLDSSVRELSLQEMIEYAIRATGFTG